LVNLSKCDFDRRGVSQLVGIYYIIIAKNR
jgi:hypothetical protein